MGKSRLEAAGEKVLSASGEMAKASGAILGEGLSKAPAFFLAIVAVSAAVIVASGVTALVGGGLLLADNVANKVSSLWADKPTEIKAVAPQEEVKKKSEPEPDRVLKQEQAARQALEQEARQAQVARLEQARALKKEPIVEKPVAKEEQELAQEPESKPVIPKASRWQAIASASASEAAISEPSQSVDCVTAPAIKSDTQKICDQYKELATKDGFDNNFYKTQAPEVQENGKIKMSFKSKEDMEKYLTTLAASGVKFVASDTAGKVLFKSDEENKLVSCAEKSVVESIEPVEPESAFKPEPGMPTVEEEPEIPLTPISDPVAVDNQEHGPAQNAL